ncbi:sacsin N-terminal ATP-binding-like domain-containing protein [Corallococcus sp. M7]
MPSNYNAIGEENQRRYGTDIGRIGPMLLVDRYDDRTHFIFELLQNAEDALGRRGDRQGPRKVIFELTPTSLTLSHFGMPFDEADVRGVCGIAESTKDRFSIGRFGIGFKSVYTFTDRPEIHSGDEDFAVENYVQPRTAKRTVRAADETQIILPLKSEDGTAWQEITAGFQHLGPGALLFLRHIDEINWSVQGGASGVYLRSDPDALGSNVQRITVIGQESDKPDVDQNWLVFHRDVFSTTATTREKVGRVEVAFSLVAIKDSPGRWSVQPVTASPLVVFFPTVVSTNLGFLVQGPFRTTPSRDNIMRDEPWNQHLVQETSGLLLESVRWMRDKEMLDVSALLCLPLDREKFPEGEIFAPIFKAVRQAFLDAPLLPCFDGGFAVAGQARLARTQELRELFSADQIAVLFGAKGCTWLTGDITQDKAPILRKYLLQELHIPEVTPEQIVPKLDRAFLEAQSDAWIAKLYSFLNGQKALVSRLSTIPLVRLDDGTHVVARENGKAKAFLPNAIETGFPTIRRAVCGTAEARSFLVSLGLTEPDPVDDVVWNVLPKYQGAEVDVDDKAYSADIDRIRAAYSTDSKAQREKLLAALRATSFVMVVDTGDGNGYVDKPSNVYIATDRMKALFAGVPDVFVVDDGYDCLRGDNMRELLEACGALRYPRPVEAPNALTRDERLELRRQTGHEGTSGINDVVVDWVLQGFDALLALLPSLKPEQRAERARLIWESLGDLEERRGRGVFDGSYSWSHYGGRRTPPFPAAFLRRLNKAAWVPDASGELVPPGLVVFDSLEWKANPFLLSKIAFKPPIIDQLAKEAGIDPAALDLLRKHGITSAADLASRLGITSLPPEDDVGRDAKADDGRAAEQGPNDDTDNRDAANAGGKSGGGSVPQGAARETAGAGHGVGIGDQSRTDSGTPRGGMQRHSEAHDDSGMHPAGANNGKTTDSALKTYSPSQEAGQYFISYVGTHPDDGPDPDGLEHAARMEIEEQAIALIISLEPQLHRTPEGNPGFDLYEANDGGQMVRWVEVKSMMRSLEERPVGLSHTQFDCAREKGDAYWLYIVEYATDPARARVLKIQNPVALTRTFTFDRGWRNVAAETRPPVAVRDSVGE